MNSREHHNKTRHPTSHLLGIYQKKKIQNVLIISYHQTPISGTDPNIEPKIINVFQCICLYHMAHTSYFS